MVNYSATRLDATFGALADPTRRAILARLARGEASVGELAKPFNVSLPAISKHLSVLERARLISRQKDGRVRRVALHTEPMQEAQDWIEQFRSLWEEQFDSLARFLESTSQEDHEKGSDQ